MCGWSRVELLTMASTHLKTLPWLWGGMPVLLWHTQQPQCQLLQWLWECLCLASPAASAVSLLTLLKGGAGQIRSQQ